MTRTWLFWSLLNLQAYQKTNYLRHLSFLNNTTFRFHFVVNRSAEKLFQIVMGKIEITEVGPTMPSNKVGKSTLKIAQQRVAIT